MVPTDFNEFFRLDFARLVAFLRKAGFGRLEAEDAAAEAMACAYQSWATLTRPRGWVRKAAYRSAVNTAMRNRERIERAIAGGWSDAGSRDDSGQCAIIEEKHEVLRRLARLPERQRLVMAYHLDGFDHAEIAELLDMSAPNVRSTLRHARERLKREYFEERGGGTDEPQ